MNKFKEGLIRELWQVSKRLKEGEWEFPRVFPWARKWVHRIIERIAG